MKGKKNVSQLAIDAVQFCVLFTLSFLLLGCRRAYVMICHARFVPRESREGRETEFGETAGNIRYCILFKYEILFKCFFMSTVN